MFKDVSNPQETSPASAPTPPANSEKESAQILVIGSDKAVTEIVHLLCALRFCHISEWSPLLPALVLGKLMLMLLRKVSTD